MATGPGAKKVTFKNGDPLFNEGQPSDCMFLIKKGVVAIRKRRGTAQVEIARVYTNEVIGELAFFDRQPRSATAVAVSAVDALKIDFKSLDVVYRDIPPYLKTIIRSVAARLRKANDMIRKLKRDVVSEDGGTGAAETDLSDPSVDLAAPSEVLGDGSMEGIEETPPDPPTSKDPPKK